MSCAASWWPARWYDPARSLADLEPRSVIKKLKDKAFARGVSREDVRQGAAELGVPLEELIAEVIAALRPHRQNWAWAPGDAPRKQSTRSRRAVRCSGPSAAPPVRRSSPGNRVDLLIDGPATYAAMLRPDRAPHAGGSISRTTSFTMTRAGRNSPITLIERARAGVRMRVLYDWVGSFGTGRGGSGTGCERPASTFAPSGRIRLTDPLLIFARDHRKVLVVDGEHAVDRWPVHRR